ncbi:hypothetical protein SLS58_008586 [Diplodia intermedia]|uniref:Cytochrome b-c1 complex subunit 8 n=1 Tax=Diplodia intermedia TaxID=856260 RepID=A0ABR3TH30_9PEZI
MGGGGYGGTNPRRLNNVYPKLTQWGDPVWGPAERGITTYRLSANRQRAMAGTLHDAVFNTWRRAKAQALYWE